MPSPQTAVDLREWLKQQLHALALDARAGVGDADAQLVVGDCLAANIDLAAGGEFNRVGSEVE